VTSRSIETPPVVDQYAIHARSIIEGKRPVPKRAVLVEFYDDNDASAVTYGMDDAATATELVALVLCAISVLSGAGSVLNAQASN